MALLSLAAWKVHVVTFPGPEFKEFAMLRWLLVSFAIVGFATAPITYASPPEYVSLVSVEQYVNDVAGEEECDAGDKLKYTVKVRITNEWSSSQTYQVVGFVNSTDPQEDLGFTSVSGIVLAPNTSAEITLVVGNTPEIAGGEDYYSLIVVYRETIDSVVLVKYDHSLVTWDGL